MIFAGITISTGRKPITYAEVDENLKIILLERWGTSEVFGHLEQLEQGMLAINILTRGRTTSAHRAQKITTDLKQKIAQVGFKPYLTNNAIRQWVETNPPACFRSLAGKPLLPRGTFEGRLQRALILSREGLQINDPMKFFQEITPYHVLNGVIPKKLLYPAAELDTLVAACIAWMLMNKPVRVDLTLEAGKQMILIPREDKDWWRKTPGKS